MTKRLAKRSAGDLQSPKATLPAPEAAVPKGPPQVVKATINDGALRLEAESGQFASLQAAFGSSSKGFQNYAFGQLLNILGASKDGAEITSEINAILAMLAGIAPQNELEAMLAAQMVAAHHLAMRELNRHAYADDRAASEAHANLGNKFLRTFTMQMEALSKLRRGGEQIVKHVHVNAGGQAVVAGTINHGGRGANDERGK